MIKLLLSAVFLIFLFKISFSQENYEIQVYSSQTMDAGNTIFELHSNFTFNGEKNIVKGVNPSYHSLHETLEITHGIKKNFEIGFYIFTNYTSPYGYKFIGAHIRPRISVPQKWNWPFGAGLSMEFGYQRREYSEDTWNAEIRPIVDKQIGDFYISFNPVFGIPLKSDSNNHTPTFEPSLKTSITIHKVAIGFEYYGNLGAINNIPKTSSQNHTLFVIADLDIDPRWEINIGPGFGLTKSADGFIFKILIGRRITWKKGK
jgi:hypothetical protein